jgi:hypothetical protein
MDTIDGLNADIAETLKSKAKIERARLKRVAARGAAKPVKKAKKAAKPKSAACARSERLDMRLTKAEKARVQGKAKKLRRTITSVVLEAVEKIK